MFECDICGEPAIDGEIVNVDGLDVIVCYECAERSVRRQNHSDYN